MTAQLPQTYGFRGRQAGIDAKGAESPDLVQGTLDNHPGKTILNGSGELLPGRSQKDGGEAGPHPFAAPFRLPFAQGSAGRVQDSRSTDQALPIAGSDPRR